MVRNRRGLVDDTVLGALYSSKERPSRGLTAAELLENLSKG